MTLGVRKSRLSTYEVYIRFAPGRPAITYYVDAVSNKDAVRKGINKFMNSYNRPPMTRANLSYMKHESYAFKSKL